ncbi:MAG: hypothetical protein KGZ93_02155 [Actinobacteria bacterium]|nr:hypothetical protein [Actinomycetota bacterium]
MTKKADYLRIPITVPPDMVEELEDLSLKAKVTGGKKLANTELVRAFVRFGLASGFDIDGCKNEDDVLAAIERVVANKQKGKSK